MWPLLFTATNAWAFMAWLLLILGPRKPAVHSAIMYLGIGLLCLAYATLFGLTLTGILDPVRAPGSGAPGFTSFDGVRAFFGSDGGVVIGWTHYLAFDLFTGLWISRDADAKSIGRVAQAPFLVLTFLVGPVGLFLWLAFRERAARRYAREAKAASR